MGISLDGNTIKDCIIDIFNQFDVGTGSLTSVRSMVEVIKEEYGQQHTVSKTQLNFGVLPYRDGEMMHVDVDNTALLALGWQPIFKFHVGIKKMIEMDLK